MLMLQAQQCGQGNMQYLRGEGCNAAGGPCFDWWSHAAVAAAGLQRYAQHLLQRPLYSIHCTTSASTS